MFEQISRKSFSTHMITSGKCRQIDIKSVDRDIFDGFSVDKHDWTTEQITQMALLRIQSHLPVGQKYAILLDEQTFLVTGTKL